MIHQTISHYIESEQLIKPQDKLLIALSGGADSVALLRILLTLGYNCEAAHCNFHLRDAESDRDEAFVRTLCDEFHVHLHVVHFDTRQYAQENKISIEMAARQLRYDWFEELRQNTQSQYIAVAHHKDDSVETILLNLIRGTGINGLTGIQPKMGYIIRPLLCIDRNQIIDYLQKIKQNFVTDSTNLQDEYTRNKIRLQLIPLLQEFNPSIKDSINNTGKYLSETNKVYHHYISETITKITDNGNINIELLLKETAPEGILYEILFPKGFNSAQINDIFQSINKQSGKLFYSKHGWQLNIDRKWLLLNKMVENDSPPFNLVMIKIANTPDFVIEKDKNIAYLDADKLNSNLEIRKWHQGDKFIPFGMKGRKLVSDLMTDLKFSRIQKDNQWVLIDGDSIVWVIGERTDNRYRIDKQTKNILKIELVQKQ